MGRVLVEAFIEGNAISPSSMLIVNRTKSKALMIKDKYEDVVVEENPIEIASKCDLLFLCVKPMDIQPILQEIKPYITPKKCLISITSPVSTDQIETVISCSVIRVIPSITNRALSGVSLFTFGENCDDFWKTSVAKLFENISVPVHIEEKITRVSSDIVSCGPAFFTYLLQRFIDAAVKETEIEESKATKLASEMIIGLGELIKQGHYTLPTLQQKVCVKGGITGKGIEVLENELGDVFSHLFKATQDKFKEDLEKTNIQFSHQ